MLYEKYKSAMQRIAAVVKFIKRYRVLFISIIASIITCVSAGMAVTGVIYDVAECPKEFVYGQKFAYEANALFEDVYYEFAVEGGDEWTQEMPREAGTYQVRAVSQRVFGSPSYGKVHSFTIKPKKVEVYVNQNKIEYGKTPTVAADLVLGDSITCDTMSYRELDNKEKSKVIPIASSIKIANEKGKDVTTSYELVPVEREIEFTLRTVEVTIKGLEVVYDGKTYNSEEYEVSDGSLAFKDSLSFAFEKTITNVGSVQNVAKIQVFTEDGINVSHQYYILIKCGDLVVNKRPVALLTGSENFLYDGTTHTE